MDEDGNPLLLSKNIIDFKPFDASGTQHSPDRYYNWAQYYGSNEWEISTLRQWLNSEEDEVQWKLNPPSEENVYKGINSYDDEPGFLNEENFSLEERNMIDEFFKDEDSMVMVIDNEGKDRSQWGRSHYDKPGSEEELSEVFEDLYRDGYRIVKGGDFRVTTMKKEIDSVFEDVGLIVTTKNVTEDPHAKFIEDMKPLHEKGDYEGIISYLEENEYLIKHPYDLFTNGIGPLNLGMDF